MIVFTDGESNKFFPGDVGIAFHHPLIHTILVHVWDPRERISPMRWHHQGRRETYFRLRHLERSIASRAAFALSLLAETALAGLESLRQRTPRPVIEYVRGVLQTLREHR